MRDQMNETPPSFAVTETAHPVDLPWEQPGWFAQVTTWIESQLAARGWRMNGPVEVVHQRPWSTFLQVSTDNGVVYFKAPDPSSAFEAALTESLAGWRPNCTVSVLATDTQQGWLLSADSGVTLRSLTRSPDQIEHWLEVLPLYAELQIELADRVPDVLAMGAPDHRPATLPRLFAQLLEDNENLRIGQDPGLKPEEYGRLRKLRPHFAAQCEALAAYGLPNTIAHEEVTEVNVITRDGRYIFTDWADSSVSHPFVSMLVTQRSIAHWVKLDENGPELARLRDVYLEPWTAFAARADLLAAFDLAHRVGMVVRALSWNQGTGSLSQKHKEPYADAVPEWLQDYLAAEKAAGL